MKKLIPNRMAGYVVALILHLSAGYIMDRNSKLEGDNPEALKVDALKYRFSTIYNMIFQMSYSGMAFYLDFMELIGQQHLFPFYDKLRRLQYTVITDLLVPVTGMITVVFWGLYFIDHELVLPCEITVYNRLVPLYANLVSHAYIVVFILWDLAHLPRNFRTRKESSTKFIYIFIVTYVSLCHLTYLQQGTYVYPLFTRIRGTPYFFVGVCILVIIQLIAYFAQWYYMKFVWYIRDKTIKKSC